MSLELLMMIYIMNLKVTNCFAKRKHTFFSVGISFGKQESDEQACDRSDVSWGCSVT